MPACLYGASVKAGEPTWYYVTDSDLDRWFGTWNVTRMAMELFNGRAYNLAALAAENPDTPPVRSWSDFILSITGTSTVARVNGVTAYGDELVAYHVFQEHCLCNAGPGSVSNVTLHDQSFSTSSAPRFWNGYFFPLVTGETLKSVQVWNTGTQQEDVSPGAGHNTGGLLSGPWFNTAVSPGSSQLGSINAPAGYVVASGVWFWCQAGPWSGSYAAFRVVLIGDTAPGAAAAPPPSAPAVTMTGAQTLPSLAGATTDQIAQAIFRLQTSVDTYGAVLETLQERLQPFGYRAGPTHAGLTATGSFAVGLCLAVRITLTTVPGTKGKIEGTPDDLFDVGGIHLGDATGWFRYVRIEHTPQLVKDIPAYAAVLGYRFPPGVVATIDELVI